MDHSLSMLAIKSFVVTVVALCVSLMFFIVGPLTESRYYPVVAKLEIMDIVDIGDNKSDVSVYFIKLRDCDYLGLVWNRLEPNGALERVDIAAKRTPGLASSLNRSTGPTIAGPWEVDMPHTQVRDLSVVEVFHRCHPFWTTRTPFYP